MEQREIAIIMKAIAPVIREAIVGAVNPVVQRLLALEGREPEKGEKGDPGRDGFDLTSFDCYVLDDDRTVELKFAAGGEEHIANFKFPTVLDRGVYKAGETYQPGDGVTWGGSFWIAQKETGAKPDTPDSGFRLAVKRGRDGKDARG